VTPAATFVGHVYLDIRCGVVLPRLCLFVCLFATTFVNLLECRGNYSATSNSIGPKVCTLAVDGWAVTFGTAKRGLDGTAARSGPSSLYQM